MDLTEALDRIDAIHSHLARAEHYRGYRPAALAASGVVGLFAALAQPAFVGDDPLAFVRYWVAVAAVCGAIAGGAIVFAYAWREDAMARRRTRVVLRQFLPCLFAGAVATVAICRPQWQTAIPLLPSIWLLIFSMGTVASLPYLPPRAGYVAAWYLLAAVALLFQESLGGWTVGVPFGVGQLFAASVVYFDRREAGR